MLKILLVEDEIKVAEFIRKGLRENNYDVDLAEDGLSAKQKVQVNNYDLIILDINIPYINGIDLCTIIRRKKPDLPVLMLTAMGDTDNKVAGFEAGADDYLVKPFEFRELLARLKSLVKRTHAKVLLENRVLKVADLEVNLDKKSVKRSGMQIELTAKEFALLEYLIQNKNRTVSRVDIAEKIWDINFETGTNVIDVYVNFLRKKIDRDFTPKLIHTHVGFGYKLVDEDSQ
jgi:two-component system, OmpR family, copper resistance phosphate regulon response regulator CusR